MSDGYVTIPCDITLSVEHCRRISACARQLDLSFDEVLCAVANASIRRHFCRSSDVDNPSEEVTGDE